MDTSQRQSALTSLTLHAAGLALLLALVRTQTGNPPVRLIDPTPLVFHPLDRGLAGGGGTRDPQPPSKGALPPRASRTFVPPSATPTVAAKLPIAVTMDLPPDMQVASAQQFGDPGSPSTVLSNGPRGPAGTEKGHGQGIGDSDGDRHGTGVDGGVFHGGYGVTMPVPLRKIEPEYSEDARKARFQGTVVVYVEVDTNGKPRNIRIVRSVGMGLDERALEAVRQWLFKPGTKDGKPVVVSANIEVTFHLL